MSPSSNGDSASMDVDDRKPAAKPDPADNAAKAAAHRENCMRHYRQKEAEHGGFRPQAMSPPPRNAPQQVAYAAVLAFFVSIVFILIRANYVFLPGSAYDCPHIYWMVDKVGCAGEGLTRVFHYIGEYAMKGMDCPHIHSIINLDMLSAQIQEEVTTAILKGIARFVPTALPATIEDALLLDLNGINVFTQLFFWSMVKSIDECPILGGAMELRSCLKRLWLAVCESGVQEHLQNEDRVYVNRRTSVHEMLNWSPLGWFLNADAEVNGKVRSMFTLLPDGWAEQIRSGRVFLENFVLSWPVGRTEKCPAKAKNGKVAITELIAGVGRYVDTYLRPPVENPETVAQCYKKDEYGEDEHEEATERFGSRVVPVEKRGNRVVFLDANEMAFSAADTTAVEYMEARRPYGEDGATWTVLCTYLTLSVMILEHKDGRVRMAFIFPPFCWAIFWKPGVQITWEMLSSMKNTIMCAQFILVFHRVCQGALDLDGLDSLKRSLFDNLLFPWAMSLYLHHALHLSDAICTLFFKNWITTKVVANHFGPDYTSQRRDGERASLLLVSKLARNSQTNERRITAAANASVRRDCFVRARSIICLTRADDVSDLPPRVDEMLEMLKTDADGDDAEGTSTNQRVGRLTKSKLLYGPLLKAVKARYDSTKHNRGNTTGNNRSASTEESTAISRGIEVWVDRKGQYFWIQWKGKAGFWPKKSPSDPARPWAPPAVGTKIYPIAGHGPFQLVIDGKTVEKPYIEYGVDVPATSFLEDIVLSSAQGRFRPQPKKKEPKNPPKEGATTKPVLQHWPQFTLMEVKGQFQLKKDKKEAVDAKHNIVLVYVTDKGANNSRKKK